MTDTTLLALAADFPTSTEVEWRALTEKALKGSDFERRLVSRSADGIAIQPLYPRRAGSNAESSRRGTAPWRIGQRVDHPDPKAANALLLADLEGGADMLALTFADSRTARGFGLNATTVEALDSALAGVVLDMIAIRLDAPRDGRPAGLIDGLVRRRNLDPAALQIDFGLDPIGQSAIEGQFADSWPELSVEFASYATELAARGFKGPFFTVDLRPVHEAGASEAQELAVALSTGIAYLRLLEAAGMQLDQSRRALSFTIALDADEFLGIAKLRALRRLWQRIEMAAGLTAEPVRIHAETAWRMLTRRDPAVNMLRATLAGFVAGVGGADSLTVLPHTIALGLPDAAARRIARNIQHVLLEESHLAKVADPAAGSGAFEELTDQLCAKAWALMQEIEGAGGIVAALESGSLQARIASTRSTRDADLARRKLQMTGTSEFPPRSEPAALLLDIAPRPVSPKRRTDFPPLVSQRFAEPFEALREAADAFAARTGQPPRVFLACLGPLAEHAPRSLWLQNLLAVGGIETVSEGDGFTSSGEAGAAFARSGAVAACIVGADATYGELGEATVQALTHAGARAVYLAGKPAGQLAALEAAGLTGTFAAGQDVIVDLTKLQEILGVRPI